MKLKIHIYVFYLNKLICEITCFKTIKNRFPLLYIQTVIILTLTRQVKSL